MSIEVGYPLQNKNYWKCKICFSKFFTEIMQRTGTEIIDIILLPFWLCFTAVFFTVKELLFLSNSDRER